MLDRGRPDLLHRGVELNAHFIGEGLALAGLDSIADGADQAAGSYPQLSTEYILDADPDLIFLAYTSGDTPTPESVAGRPGWDGLAPFATVGSSCSTTTSPPAGVRACQLLKAVVAAVETVPPA